MTACRRWVWSAPILIFWIYNLLHPSWGGISHFDEGQYAFARVWPWIDEFDVNQSFFSPPLFPFLVGLFQHFPGSRPDMAGAAISQIAFLASIIFAYLLAVSWWGRGAGVAALILVLSSSMGMSFGSIGLTDSLFSALMLATFWSATNAFRRRSGSWTLATGLLAGSCWSCKYNGFIAIGIVAGFFLHQRTAKAFLRWTGISLVAAGVMVPWFWAIHRHHPDGLSALQQHQAGYVRGLAAIPSGLLTAIQLRGANNEPQFGLLIAPIFVLTCFLSTSRLRLPVLGAATLVVGDALASGFLIPIAGLICLPCSVASARSGVRIPFVIGVLFTTFLPAIYTPYLRLWLPADYLLSLSCAGLLAALPRYIPSRRSVVWPVIGVVSILAGTSAYIVGGSEPVRKRFESDAMRNERLEASPILRPLASRRPWGYKLAADHLVKIAKETNAKRMVLYVRPPLLFYLANSDLRLSVVRSPDQPLPTEWLTPGTIVVTDIAMKDSKSIRDSFAKPQVQRRLKRIASIPIEPHIITILDDFGPIGPPSKDAYNVHVYSVKEADR